MSQIQVITGAERRRRWNDEQKRALVAEAFAPGAVVTEVARRADVSSTLLYRWRRQFAGGSVGFAEVMLTGPGRASSHDAMPAPSVEIDFVDGARVRIPVTTRPELAAAIVKALSCRPVRRSPGDGG